ncbi:MAG: MAPEG family protein [Alphaproteobacteria bacterium]|nr:MAPEG family protein [Alphaproteobacteria bacterium]
MHITPFYAALLGLMLVALSIAVIRQRGRAKVALGDGGDKHLQRAIRAHANFVEFAPLALLLIAMAEWQGSPAWLVHIMGAALVIGRGLHGFGISQEPERFIFRQAGMMLTFSVLIVAALACMAGSLL